MDIKLIKELAEVLNSMTLSELDYSKGNERIILKKNISENSEYLYNQNSIQNVSKVSEEEKIEKKEIVEEDIEELGLEKITANIIGTFYDSPSPDEAKFVSVGTKVKKGDVLCIIESMKLMNEIKSPFDCEIVSIYASNEEIVEFGQELFGVKVM